MNDKNYSDIITEVIKENEKFLIENANDSFNEVVELMNDSIDYSLSSIKRNKEHYAKYSMAFFIHHILMPSSYAIYVDLLTGNLPVCFMGLRFMLESLVKCYLADLKYPDQSFFQEKLKLLEKETKSKNDVNVSKREYDFMEELDRELGLNKKSIALWGKLSKDWIHTKGIVNRIVNEIAEKQDIPAWALVIPMNFNKSDLDSINELYKSISQFRFLLNFTLEKYQQRAFLNDT